MKVFLVEDEIIMREGIRNNIEWEKEGFEFVGEASDGELAYPLILKTKPDILITDIRMPFMDGLELSRLVKKELPQIKIIILSGYEEFEYAREGIRVGIAEYLLKPIDGAKLLEAVKKVADQIKKEQEEQYAKEKKSKQAEGMSNIVGINEKNEVGGLEVRKLDRRKAERFLKTGLKSEISDFVEDYFLNLGEKNIQSILFRQYVLTDLYFAAVSMIEELGYKAEDLLERCGEMREMGTVGTSLENNIYYVKKIFEAAIELREVVSKKKYHAVLEDAKAYIERNYNDVNISLNSVASSVSLSPNHFSSIFSQEVGRTFIEYLTTVRMEKAKELLKTSSMTSAEIAYAVGYKDAHYFSSLFKKTQNCTPKEYRLRA